MRAIDLEARVIAAVDRIRGGQPVEHDLIECKRTWPQEKKARQLAGSLNRAGGDPVVYIVGIDEKTGLIHDVSETDILDWWSQIVPQFDHTPPELVRHLNIQVGEGGEHVVALAIASDRAPYVVKTGGANPSLEVPMREGTGTRSARRDELLRLLIPAVTVPQAIVLQAKFYIHEHFDVPQRLLKPQRMISNARRGDFQSLGTVRIYVEHNGKEPVTFPAHGMRGRVLLDGNVFPLRVRQNPGSKSLHGSRDLTAVQLAQDGITVSGPGAISVVVGLPDLDPDDVLWFETTDTLGLEIELDVLHAVKPLRVEVTLQRPVEEPEDTDTRSEYQRTVGKWNFAHSGLWTSG